MTDTYKPSWVPEEENDKFACRVMYGVTGGHEGTPGVTVDKKDKVTPAIKRRKLEVDDYVEGVLKCDRAILSRAITLVESNAAAHFETAQQVIQKLLPYTGKSTRVGITGVPGAGKSTFIRAVSAAKPKVADYPFTTLVPSLGVVKVDESHSFVVADIPGLIEGASDGAGLGIRFLKHLERCRVLIHLVDINPIDESDPADNIAIIESELFQYSEKLADKPRWLVFNKIDTMTEEEAHERAQEITERLGWEEGYHLISAATGKNVPPLCRDIMDFIEANPRDAEVEENKPEEVKFKWEDYHQEQLAEHQFDDEDDDWDDWDEEDEEGVEFIYKP